MNSGSLKRAGALVAVSAIGLAVYASAGTAAAPKAGEAATITATSNGKNLEFTGSTEVSVGSKLKIVNATNPKEVGPHTFSLVKANKLPTTRSEMRACEKLEAAVCKAILVAQGANPETGMIKRPDVDVGKKGWDTSFGKTGDTWFTQEEGEIESRPVTASPGTLHYLCLIHPFMQGKIKVVK